MYPTSFPGNKSEHFESRLTLGIGAVERFGMEHLKCVMEGNVAWEMSPRGGRSRGSTREQ